MSDSLIDRISPIFFAWHDSGNAPHFHKEESYGRRVVHHYEAAYIVSSRSGCIIINNIPVPATEGDIFFFCPGMIVEGIGVYRCLYLEFDLNHSGEVFPLFETIPSILPDVDSIFSNEAFFLSLSLEKGVTVGQYLHWKALVLRLLSALLKRSDEGNPFLGDDPQIQKVKNALLYINKHYIDNITVQDLANEVGYSTFYFCKLFKKITQLSPMQYILRYRLEKAKNLLLTSDNTTESIMLNTGFHHYGYFWRAFKQVYGSSPQEYRELFHAEKKNSSVYGPGAFKQDKNTP